MIKILNQLIKIVIPKSLSDRYNKIIDRYNLRRYNDFTIAEFFRKQGAEIGEDNRLQIRSLGSEPFLVSIGDHCTIANNVRFATHDGGAWIFTKERPDIQRFSRITILDNCFIGINSILIGNITIGPNSIVGAGSVVTKDVPGNTIVAGNPAKLISNVNEYKKKIFDLWEQQKPPNYLSKLDENKNYTSEYVQNVKRKDMPLLKEHLLMIFKNDNGKK